MTELRPLPPLNGFQKTKITNAPKTQWFAIISDTYCVPQNKSHYMYLVRLHKFEVNFCLFDYPITLFYCCEAMPLSFWPKKNILKIYSGKKTIHSGSKCCQCLNRRLAGFQLILSSTQLDVKLQEKTHHFLETTLTIRDRIWEREVNFPPLTAGFLLYTLLFHSMFGIYCWVERQRDPSLRTCFTMVSLGPFTIHLCPQYQHWPGLCRNTQNLA